MSIYKWENEGRTLVRLLPDIISNTTNREFQEYLDDGGQVDPFKTFDEWVAHYQTKAKQDCQAHIYNFYSPPIQQSMALGIYPAELVDIMVSFIAACVDAENTYNGQYAACTTEDELKAVSVTWALPGV